MKSYGKGDWDKAVPGLEEAAAVCPVPDRLWTVSPFSRFHYYSYLPFFYLGSCHFELKQLPDALRNFYLSSCVGEPARDPKQTEKLGSWTESCRLRISSKKRPAEHPYYGEWSAALQKPKWDEAAEKMWDALQVWEEDGKMMSSAGRFPTPYLPRFRLADALFRLGCYQQACEQLDRSKLEQIDPKGREQERKRLAELKPQCQKKPRDQDNPICQQWRCWLGQGSP